MTSNLIENGEENYKARDCGLGGSHHGVSVFVNWRFSVGGAIQHLEFGD